MAHLEPVDAWPPAPIRTERLVLREPEARDRGAVIELFASPEVGTYIGGARPREELERGVPEVPRRRPGLFVVERDGAMIGVVTIDRRDAERRGHLRPEGGEAELGYLFLPEAWGRGYAAEACAAALDWFARALPGEPVLLTTQTANERSMRVATKLGFIEAERFEEYGAEQWLGVWRGASGSAARGEPVAVRPAPASGVIRRATWDDREAVAALRRAWTEEQIGREVEDDDYLGRFEEWLEQEQHQRVSWLAWVGEQPVGMLNMLVFTRMPRPGRVEPSQWGYLANFFVRAEHRAAGLGARMLQACTAYADEHHFVRIVLSPSERSVPFYARAGFEPATSLMVRQAD